MSSKVLVVLEDDLDGSKASETVTFALDGTQYEIDLNDQNAQAHAGWLRSPPIPRQQRCNREQQTEPIHPYQIGRTEDMQVNRQEEHRRDLPPARHFSGENNKQGDSRDINQ